MANFKTHISWGAVVALLVTVSALFYIGLEADSLVLIFCAIIVGSFLPDIDSDSGVPFRIVFGFLGIVFAIFSAHIVYEREDIGFWLFLLVPLTVFIFTRFVLGDLFKRFTHHRGIWHSLPAAALAGLLTFILLDQMDFLEKEEMSIYMSSALVIGYVVHLLLDEICASVNLVGHSLRPKKSLGSALKFYSESKKATIFVYVCIAMLVLYIFL